MRKAKRTFLEEHDLPISAWRHLLREWIADERNRDIFDRAYLENVPYDQLAAEEDLSVRQVKKIAQDIERFIVTKKNCI